jgi:F-type H+-transporting ATPase subunit epsilon
MAKTFHLTITTSQEIVYSGEVMSLVAPSALGYFGILADHAPMAAALARGKLIYKEDQARGGVMELAGSGLLEVLKNKVNIYCDRVEAK